MFQDTLEFKPKFRPISFEMRVYPHDHPSCFERPYCSLDLLVAQNTLVSEVVQLLCNTTSVTEEKQTMYVMGVVLVCVCVWRTYE